MEMIKQLIVTMGALLLAAASAQGTAGAPAPFLAISKTPVMTIDLLSAGRFEIVDGCVTALLQGRRYTAVFPPGARLVRDGGSWSAVRYQGRSIAIGREIGLPGGGARVARGKLVLAVPAKCPREMFVVGG